MSEKKKHESTTQSQGDSHRRLNPGCDFSALILLPHGKEKNSCKLFSNFCLISQSRKPPLIMLWIVNLPQNPTPPGSWGILASQVRHTELAMCFLGTAGTASEHLQPVLGRGRDCFVLNLMQQSPTYSMGAVWLLQISHVQTMERRAECGFSPVFETS